MSKVTELKGQPPKTKAPDANAVQGHDTKPKAVTKEPDKASLRTAHYLVGARNAPVARSTGCKGCKT